MYQVHVIKWKPLLVSIVISLGVGILAGLLTMESMQTYKSLVQPALVPPSFVFPIVWTALYVLMGISAYLIYISPADAETKKKALMIYGIQLIMNFFWTIIFFTMQAYLFAFLWLVSLWILILAMIFSFCKINQTAAVLQIPYLLWVAFAGYLNFQIYLLNK